MRLKERVDIEIELRDRQIRAIRDDVYEIRQDIKLLVDYLGLEITHIPNYRKVVKKDES